MANTVFGNGQWMDYTEQLHDALKAQIAEDKKIGIVGEIEISGGDHANCGANGRNSN